MRDNGPPYLVLEGIGKAYAKRTVLHGIGLTLERGEILLVTGANGAGKSTLLKIMAGALVPSQGQVRWAVDQGMIAYMGHRTFLYPGLSAAENLRFWARLYGKSPSREELVAVLRRTGLAHVLHEPVGHFSRGMAQRLSLSRMLLIDPVVLLLDEPGTGLDRSSREMLKAEIARAKDAGKSIVWVSHDLENDVALADRVLALESAKAAYLGPAKGYQGGGCAC
jgi:heme exporter protein A